MAEQPTTDQLQGYDQIATMFSPEGRLRQVEYANKTAQKGSATIGMICSDGVICIVYKRSLNPLRISMQEQKIMQIDEHALLSMSGLISDGRLLAENAQIDALRHRMTYDSSMDIKSIVEQICDIKQKYTQFEGLRPFGISMLVTGIDETGPKLFRTETSGVFTGFRATVIGENEEEIHKLLQERYSDNLTVKESLILGMDIFKEVMKEKFNPDKIEGAYVKSEDKKFRRFDRDEISNIASSLESA